MTVLWIKIKCYIYATNTFLQDMEKRVYKSNIYSFAGNTSIKFMLGIYIHISEIACCLWNLHNTLQISAASQAQEVVMLEWNHRSLCQSPLLYPNTIVLHGYTLRLSPHYFAIPAFLLLVKALRFPHPLIAISLVSFFTGKCHQERHSTTNSAN